jgi:hypothetical protein
MTSMVEKRVSLRPIFGVGNNQKANRGEFQRVRWLGDKRNVSLDEELLQNKRCMARYVILIQKQLSLPAIFRAAYSELHSTAKFTCRNNQ